MRTPEKCDADPRSARAASTPVPEADPPSGGFNLSRVIRKTFGRLLIAFAVVCLPLLGLGIKHLIDGGRLWWSQRQATRAAAVKVDEDPNAGAASIINAMRASPNDPKILRTWADYLKRHGGSPADRVSALRQVVASAEATTPDRAELACALTDDGKFGEAKTIFGSLPEAERATTTMLEARARLLDATGDREGGERLRREAWTSDAENPESKFKLALLGLGEFYEEKRRQAFATLWTLAHGKDDIALKAAEVIAGHGALSKRQAEELLALVEQHPKTSMRHVLIATAGILRTHPESRDKLIEDEVMKSTGYGPEDLIDLGFMLDQAGAYKPMLAVISEEKAFLNRELCILRIKALTKCKNFSGLDAMLTGRRPLPISKGHISVLTSYLHLEKGEMRDAVSSLTLALKRAIGDHDTETVRRVAVFSEEQGWWDLAADCHQWMSSESGGAQRMAALHGLFKAASSKRDAALMLSTAERIADGQQENVPAQTNLAYLRLLLGSRMETVPLILSKLDAGQPASTELAPDESSALIAAFLSYRFGDKDGVRRNVARVSDWSRIPPGQRAVAATLLRFSGNDALAYDLAAALPTLALLSEEQNLWATPREQ